jgi:hypothetical protein
LWAKTFAALLIGTGDWFSRRCALTWKLKGTPFNRSFFQLQVSAHPTEEIASGLLLTPTTREEVMDKEAFQERMEKYDNGTTVPNLATQVVGLLPTPTTQEPTTTCELTAAGRRKTKDGKKSHSLNIGRMASMGMLPTPAARDTQGAVKAGKRVTKTGKIQNYGKQLPNVAKEIGGKNSRLSAQFVGEMMGFPKNWTESPFQSGAMKL